MFNIIFYSLLLLAVFVIIILCIYQLVEIIKSSHSSNNTIPVNKKINKQDDMNIDVHSWLILTKLVSTYSTCLNKHWGAVIIKDDRVISTGYTSAPKGRKQCNDDIGDCWRRRLENEGKIIRGTSYDMCRSVHAEQHAINIASLEDLQDSILYLYGYDVFLDKPVDNPGPCPMCKRTLIDVGIKAVRVVIDTEDGLTYEEHPIEEYITHDDTLDTCKLGY